MIVCFVLDTSASCNQRCSNGLTLLDMSKSGVEHFLKVRARDWASRADRYLLVTCGDGVSAIQAEWRDSYADFQHALKNVAGNDTTNLSVALLHAFDLLTQFRLQSGIDSYAQGRRPSNCEPAIVVVLTDGGELTSLAKGVMDTLVLPHTTQAGHELTLDPFRWDMRVFSVVLRVPGVVSDTPPAPPPPHAFPVHAICEATGGRTSVVSSMKELMTSMEHLATRVASQRGVVVALDCALDPTPAPLPPLMRVFLQLPAQAPSLWPIPEAYFPSSAMTTFPPRAAIPVLTWTPDDASPAVPPGFPVDRYELGDASALSAYLSEHCSPGSCWYVHVKGSGAKPTPRAASMDMPCAFLRLMKSTAGASEPGRPALAVACLFVLPWNFPVLFRLLNDLVGPLKRVPTPKWQAELETYLASVPPYYITALRTALKTMNLPPGLISDRADTGLNFAMAKHLKKLSFQSKVESDRLAASLSQARAGAGANAAAAAAGIHASTGAVTGNGVPGNVGIDGSGASLELEHDDGNSDNTGYFSRGLTAGGAGGRGAGPAPAALSNAYDIPRQQLLPHLDVLRDVVWGKLDAQGGVSEEDRHSVRISEMGNYQEAMKKRAPLRHIDPDEDRKQHRFDFGNPFRRDKTTGLIPEADELQGEGMPSGAGQGVPGSPARSPRLQRGTKRRASALDAAVVPDAKRARSRSASPRPGAGADNTATAAAPALTLASLRALQSQFLLGLRQPGYKLDAALALLESVQGPARGDFLHFVVREAKRMKRHDIVDAVEELLHT